MDKFLFNQPVPDAGFDLVRVSHSKAAVDLCSNTIRKFFEQVGDQRRGVEIAFIEGDGQADAVMANKGKAVFCQGVCRVRQKARGQNLDEHRR